MAVMNIVHFRKMSRWAIKAENYLLLLPEDELVDLLGTAGVSRWSAVKHNSHESFARHFSASPKKSWNQGTPHLFLFIPFFPSWLLPFKDTTQYFFKPSDKTVVPQGSACLFMTSYPLDLLFGYTHQKKVPPIPNHFNKGIDLHQMVACA